VDEIAGGLQRTLEDERLRNTLINKGQLRVQKFSWVSAARQLLTHYAALVR
jgi:glycosyltransferase involved in cell wall biosynthesis